MPRGVEEVTWRAFTDVSFREGLLNGQRRQLLAELNLGEAEREALLAVRADSLEAFAGALCEERGRAGFMGGM